MRAALVIAVKDLRERIRDRSALILGIAAPFGLAAVMSAMMPSNGGFHADYGFVDGDDSAMSTAFFTGPLTALEEAGIASVVVLSDEEAARSAIESGTVDAAAIFEFGFGRDVAAGTAAEVTIIGDPGAGLATQILRSVAEGYVAEIEAVRLSVATVLAAGGTPPDAEEVAALAARAVDATSPLSLVDAPSELRRMTTATFFAASMGIFFLFFTAQFGILSIMAERRKGTLPRLLAAPIPPWSIVAGKAAGSFVLGVGAMAVIVIASTLLLGAAWGNPLGVGILVVAAVLAAMGITALVTTLARTEEQAGGWNSIVAVTLGILGGSFFDLSQAPAILSGLSSLAPHSWFLRGLDQLAAPSVTPADLALPVGALLAFALVTGGIGLLRADALVSSR